MVWCYLYNMLVRCHGLVLFVQCVGSMSWFGVICIICWFVVMVWCYLYNMLVRCHGLVLFV